MISSHIRKSTLLGLAISLAIPAMTANAAPVLGPNGMAFYDSLPVAGATKGDLLQYRQATVQLGEDTPDVQAWNVMYRSTDSLGAANVVTGTVIVPATAWNGGGERPTLGYAVGTHGLAQGCAPSLQLANGTDYEADNIRAALEAGYAVLVSDNPGYTNGDVPTYLAGKAQGQAMLDIFRAASQIPDAGISSSAKAAIWGYSQGGQTAAWAGELKGEYAPGLNLVGIAAGGTPGDFPTVANYLEKSVGASFLVQAIVGLGEQYPDDLPVDELANSQGKALIAEAKTECVFESLFTVMNESIATYTVNNRTLPELLAIPSVSETVNAQNLGSKKIPVPLYQYHGQADEIIPIGQHADLKRQYCGKFTKVAFDVFPSEHIVTQFQAAPHVLSWIGDRVAGERAPNSCLTLKPEPQSTANPGGGNFVVTLDEWKLDAAILLNKLDQTVTLPATSTLTADADITAQSLEGMLEVPEFVQRLNILLPLDVKLSVKSAEPTTGSISLDGDGQLHIDGNAYTSIEVKSAGFGFLQIPFGCKTAESVAFPIVFDGPVSKLGNGGLSFSGETSFPELEGCGLFTGLFTTLMSGPGQVYDFNVEPPAPFRW
ncbi:MAG: Triacylglycerol lipase [Alteromonadaceae bacterium]|nr:Triacylglycerol lipase [Alteromonadaceae bacterium]|tara:strand:- start:5840 stop:7642 length:1803 start_codon:yes stop_codon:yes gene_type:complete